MDLDELIEILEQDILTGISFVEPVLPEGEWLVGGSARVFFDLYHRIPHDVDIFIKTDRLSEIAKKVSDSEMAFSQAGNKLTINVGRNIEVVFLPEIFHVNQGAENIAIGDRLVPMRSFYSVIRDKMILRQFSFKAQDMFDVAAAYETIGEDFLTHLHINENAFGMLKARADLFASNPEFLASISGLSVADDFLDVKTNLVPKFKNFLNDYERLEFGQSPGLQL